MDKKMQWIRLFEENLESGSKEEYFTEYEICSEVRIPGVFEYADGSLLCGLLSEKDERGLYAYIVRVKSFYKEFKFNEKEYSKNGYYFKNGLIGELLAIFSVYFQARFFLKSVISGKLTPTSIQSKFNKPFRYMIPGKALNYEMFTNQERNWAYQNGLKKFLDDIRKIDQKYHQRIIQSFYWYSEAIKEIGTDKEFFYIKMVSCAESLLEFIELYGDELNDKMNDLISLKGNFVKPEKNEIKGWLKNRKIKQRFVKFIKIYSKGFFKGGNRKAKHCYIKKDDLENYLKRIYNARSDYIHEGKPMYISSDMDIGVDGNCHLWDLDPSSGTMIDKRKITEKEKLPRMRWFERIVNYSLKKFIEEKSIKRQPAQFSNTCHLNTKPRPDRSTLSEL